MVAVFQSNADFNTDLTTKRLHSFAIYTAAKYMVIFTLDGEDELNQIIKTGIEEMIKKNKTGLTDIQLAEVNLGQITYGAIAKAKEKQETSAERFDLAKINREILKYITRKLCPVFPFC